MLVSRFSKVLVAGMLALLLVAGFPSWARAERSPFTDLPADHWAYAAVQDLVGRGILSGYPDGSFRGNNLVTRYALAVSLAKAMEDGVLAGGGGGRSRLAMEDVETLERLIKEFGDELSMVGVKTAAMEEQLQAHRRQIEELEFKVSKLEEGRQGSDQRVRFLDGRLRGRVYNKSALNGSLDAIVNLGLGVDEDVDGVIGLRYTNTFDQISNETLGTYEAFLRSTKQLGPVDSVRLGKMNNFLGNGMVLYDLREGLELRSTRQDLDFELSYFDAFLAHVSTDILGDGRLGFYYLKQDRIGNRRPTHLGVYAHGEMDSGISYGMEFTEYDNDGVTVTNRDDATRSLQLGLGYRPRGNKNINVRLGFIKQGEDYRALAVDSDLRWHDPTRKVSPHHDVLQALRDATPAGVDPDEIPGFRDLQLGFDLDFGRSPWRARFDLDLLRGDSTALNHADDDFDVLTVAVGREMGESLDLQLRYQSIGFDNENVLAVVDALPTLKRQDFSNLRAQLVKRF